MTYLVAIEEIKMAGQITNRIKDVFATIKKSFIPALFCAVALVMFYGKAPYETGFNQTIHYIFLTITFIGLGFLYLTNRAKPFFSLLLGFCTYLVVNWLKQRDSADFINSPEYLCLCFALPLNLLAFYFLPLTKLRSRLGQYALLALLTQFFLIQHAGSIILQIPYINIAWESVPLWSLALWVITLITILADISLNNTLINTATFYADSCLLIGLVYCNEPSALTTFFCAFSLILVFAAVMELYHQYRYDYLDHVSSQNSYLSHANNKFPFKYTIGLFCIDNRDKLLTVIGPHKMQVLEQMLINRIRELPYDFKLYRYNESELIMVFKNEDAKHTREFADNIRHTIAASEFIFTNKKSLKITISVCVSEKTRKDLNAVEVTERAHNALQKAYRFNCNVTTVAS